MNAPFSGPLCRRGTETLGRLPLMPGVLGALMVGVRAPLGVGRRLGTRLVAVDVSTYIPLYPPCRSEPTKRANILDETIRIGTHKNKNT